MTASADLQEKVDSMLRRGIIFSIFWLMGVGSLIAVIQAARANAIIRRSQGIIKGKGKVIWCFVVGGLGLMFWGYVLVMLIIGVITQQPNVDD